MSWGAIGEKVGESIGFFDSESLCERTSLFPSGFVGYKLCGWDQFLPRTKSHQRWKIAMIMVMIMLVCIGVSVQLSVERNLA